jgi:hypothetical protein
MAKKSGSGGKERITPPSDKDTSAGGKLLRKGNPAGGRVMADRSVAKKQNVKRDQ